VNLAAPVLPWPPPSVRPGARPVTLTSTTGRSCSRTIDPSRLDMNTAIVVFVSATRRYRPASEDGDLAVRGGLLG
jgi:hypothetical protein